MGMRCRWQSDSQKTIENSIGARDRYTPFERSFYTHDGKVTLR